MNKLTELTELEILKEFSDHHVISDFAVPLGIAFCVDVEYCFDCIFYEDRNDSYCGLKLPKSTYGALVQHEAFDKFKADHPEYFI